MKNGRPSYARDEEPISCYHPASRPPRGNRLNEYGNATNGSDTPAPITVGYLSPGRQPARPTGAPSPFSLRLRGHFHRPYGAASQQRGSL